VRLLFLGDIIGRPGPNAGAARLGELVDEYSIDFVIANAENASGGLGLMPEAAQELLHCGIDVLTTGNHVWAKRQLYPLLDQEPRLLRPHNYPLGNPGHGVGLYQSAKGEPVGVINLLGRTFMEPLESPFTCVESLVEGLRAEGCGTIVLDFHAEATSEKHAMGWLLDGKVTAVLGTHTHVQTNDARLLEAGTAYVTDVGLCGPRDSVLGLTREPILQRFLLQTPQRFEVAKGPVLLCGAVIAADEGTGKATSVTLVQELAE
jgi:metallophosphoesterase (TIGR00282 family)